MSNTINLIKLSGQKSPNAAYRDIVKKGFKKSDLVKIQEALGLKERELIAVLPISQASYYRVKKTGAFDLTTSEHIIFLAKVAEYGLTVFSVPENFHRWLHVENKALGNQKPVEFLTDIFGCQSIINVLGRTLHGVYS